MFSFLFGVHASLVQELQEALVALPKGQSLRDLVNEVHIVWLQSWFADTLAGP
jgi:hypothetical protein